MNEAVAWCLGIEDAGEFRETLLECVDEVRCGPSGLTELAEALGRLERRVDGPEKRAACREARERVASAAEAVESAEWSRAATLAIAAGDDAIVETLDRIHGRLIHLRSDWLRRELRRIQDHLRVCLSEPRRRKGEKSPEYVPTPDQIAESAALERATWTPRTERERRAGGRAAAREVVRMYADPLPNIKGNRYFKRYA